MNIAPINNVSFKANLFYQGRPVTSGKLDDVDIATYGLADTDILVTKISSTNTGSVFSDNNYVNRITFSLNSPLYGKCNFENKYIGTTSDNPHSSNIETDNLLYGFFTSKKNVEKFENATLRKTLLQKINENAFLNKHSINKTHDTDALNILYKKLNEVDFIGAGITSKRIKELYSIARDVNNEVAIAGARQILDMEA